MEGFFQIKYANRPASNHLDKMIEKAYNTQQYSIELVTSCGRKVGAHNIILMMFSNYLKPFAHDAIGKGIAQVPLPNLSYDVVNQLVELIYFREIWVAEEHKEEFVNAIKFLELKCEIMIDGKRYKDGEYFTPAPRPSRPRAQTVVGQRNLDEPRDDDIDMGQNINTNQQMPRRQSTANRPVGAAGKQMPNNGAQNPAQRPAAAGGMPTNQGAAQRPAQRPVAAGGLPTNQGAAQRPAQQPVESLPAATAKLLGQTEAQRPVQRQTISLPKGLSCTLVTVPNNNEALETNISSANATNAADVVAKPNDPVQQQQAILNLPSSVTLSRVPRSNPQPEKIAADQVQQNGAVDNDE